MRIGVGDRHKALRGIDSPMACHLLEQAKDFTFHLEYIPQADDTMIDDVVDRVGSACTLQSLAFMVTVNEHEPAADTSYYYMVGCKPNTVRISASHNTEYTVTIDYSVKSTTTGSLVGSAPSALTGSYLAFNTSSTGAITAGGVAFAYVTNSIDLNFNHNLTDRWDHDSTTKDYCVEGAYDIDGSVDISLDEGGSVHFGHVIDMDAFDLVVNMGGVGSPRISIANCQWRSSEIDLNVGGEDYMESAPFTGKPTSCSALVDSVPAP